jgi:signal transduction histidine kinase
MKLATRMTVALGACALLLFGGAGWLQLQHEQRDLRVVARSEALLLGRSLQTAFENALRDRQLEDVKETLEALSQVDRSVAIFVFDEVGKLVGSSKGAHATPDTLRIEATARGQQQPVFEFLPEPDPSVLRVGLRLRDEAPASASAIVLEKPLAELQRDLQETRRDIVLSALAFVFAVAALTWLLSRRYVAAPLARMVATMRRVRAGDLQIAPGVRRADEVGETQAEFDRLVQDLEAARVRADQELEARRRMERGLQNADKLITLGQLSAVMAHEIGSPLQILEGRARALHKHPDNPEATRRVADILVEQTARITRIVGQMLSITRRRSPVRAQVDAEVSVRSVTALLEVEARRRQVRLRVERRGRCDVFADADQLQQVALNLIRNALEASPPGTAVTIGIGGDDARLSIDVADQGSGVAEQVRAHLFEPFFTTKADAGGSGLGLSVVRSIVQEHGGQVEFVEQGASGCVVRVSLPRQVEVISA